MLSFNSESQQTQSSDENSDIRRLQESNNQLRHNNEKLTLELTSLRSQFNEATSISTQLEQIHQKNTKLASDLRNVTIERDELSHRLDINIQVIDELRAAKDQEKRENERRVQTEISEARESYERSREELNDKLNKTTNELKETIRQLQTQQSENECLNASVKNVIEASQTYFVQPIKTIEQLISFLTESSINNHAQKTSPVANAEKKDSQSQDMQKQYKILKQKAREEHKIRKEEEARISVLEDQLRNLKSELDRSKSKYESSILDLQKKLEIAEMQKKSISTTSESRITELKTLLENERAKSHPETNDRSKDASVSAAGPQPSTEVSSLQNKLSSLDGKLKEAQSSIFALRKQNATLVNQLNDSENAKELLRRKYQTLNDETDQNRKSIDQIKSENSQLVIDRDDLKEQLETALAQVQAAKSSFNQSKSAYSEAECHIDKLQNSVKIAESVIAKQKDEIITLVRDRNQCVNSLHKQNEALLQSEQIIGRLSEENKQQKKTISAQAKSLRESETLPRNEEIPPTSWFCIDFPRSLCALISDIAQNVALPTTAKLRNVLSCIAKYYNKQLEEETKSKENTNEKLASIVDRFDHFLIALGQIVDDQSLTAEAFLADPKKEGVIINSLTDLQNLKLSQKLNKTQLENDLCEILSKLHVNSSSDAVKAVDSLIEQIGKYRKILEEDKSIQKKLTRALRAMKSSSHDNASNSRNQISELQTVVGQLQDENHSLKDQLSHNDAIISQLKGQLDDVNFSHSAALNAKQDEKSDEIQYYQNQLKEHKTSFAKEIEARDQQIQEISEKADKFERELNQWKKTSEMLKAAKTEKDQQIQSLMTQIDEAEKDFRQKLENEKENLKSQYEKSVVQIKAKNVQLRDLVANVSAALNDSEERNKTLLTINSQLSIEKQQMAARVEAQSEEQNRDKQLTEAKLKTLELSLTTQRQMDLEDERAKFEEEKRKLFGIVASSFHSLFDARQQLNDKGFRSFVEKCANELTKFLKQDSNLRRLLGLEASESIEDAVQKILLTLYH